MQRDKARLHNVLHSFAFFMQVFKELEQSQFKTKMISRLERRWGTWEQPLLLLSFILHPRYRLNYFDQTQPYINFTHIGAWLCYYYKAWFGNEPNHLLFELEEYKQKKYPFTEKTFKQFKDDIIFWWSHNSGAAPELSRIACQLFSICVTTASVERLFSTMGFFHSPLRNRLGVSIVKSIC